MHDSDWLRKAFMLSLISYISTHETAVRHSDWLYRLFYMNFFGVARKSLVTQKKTTKITNIAIFANAFNSGHI